jgi:hypothetical protein
MNALALVQTNDRNINQLQQNVAQAINPIIQSAPNNSNILTGVKLSAGNNTISHGLGRTLQGWIPVRYHGSWAQIYDNQDSNPNPSKTLILNASAAVTVDLEVF